MIGIGFPYWIPSGLLSLVTWPSYHILKVRYQPQLRHSVIRLGLWPMGCLAACSQVAHCTMYTETLRRYKTQTKIYLRHLLLGDKMRRCLSVRPIFSVPGHRNVSGGPGQGPDIVLAASDHRSWTPDGPVKLRITDSGYQSIKPISVPSLFRWFT